MQFLKSIKGLENCVVSQAGYAIEYDYVDPRELLPTLETKKFVIYFLLDKLTARLDMKKPAGRALLPASTQV